MTDFVTAYIATYNRNKLLFKRSLPSILKQTRPVDEIIIVADGMEGDALVELEDRVAQVQDGRIKLYNIERPEYPTEPGSMWSVQGWKARNWALDHASGNWIAPLDDDDEWTDNHIEVLLDAALKEGVDFAYGKARTNFGQEYGYWPPGGMNFTDGSQLYRHDMGYRYDPECLSRWLPTDADLWGRMIEGGVTFTFVSRLVHHYFPAKR